VEALERSVPVGVGGTGECLGVAERRLLGLGVKVGLPPRTEADASSLSEERKRRGAIRWEAEAKGGEA
jgi:hypothetical protein